MRDCGRTAKVLADAAIRELFGQLEATTLLWRDRVNRSLADAQQVDTVTLDFEFDTVASGWPALTAGALPSRLVLTQARSLDPGLRGIPAEVLDLPVPRDVLARAGRVRQVCSAAGASIEILTDPLRLPDVGYSDEPFIVDGTADDCVDETLFATPARLLHDLLATGTPLT